MKKINGIQEEIIRRILMVPQGTPKKALYIESGLLDIETMTDKLRLAMEHKMDKNPNQLTSRVRNARIKGGWQEVTEEKRRKYGITREDIRGSTGRVKREIHTKCRQKMENNLRNDENKTKIKFLLENKEQWQAGKRPQYMGKLNRTDASIIFKARTRMLDVKHNYKGKYRGTVCRKCNTEEETQEHVLDHCTAIHANEESKVKIIDLFKEETVEIKETAKKIKTIMTELEK